MTNANKLSSEKKLYLFHRVDGFYPIELPCETVADNARCNPGTIMVTDAVTGETVWHSVTNTSS